jgi:hypothetical protein
MPWGPTLRTGAILAGVAGGAVRWRLRVWVGGEGFEGMAQASGITSKEQGQAIRHNRAK